MRPGSNLAIDDVCNILKSRIRDLDVKENFPNSHKDTKCPFPLCDSSESQAHLFSCESYPDDCNIIPIGMKYENLFESNTKKQYQIMNILITCIAVRNNMFSSNHHKSGEPEDPRRKEKPVERNTARGTSRQALSLVIRGRRRRMQKSSRHKYNHIKKF